MPEVSIIIPLYNQSGYVGEAIQSVLDQTFRDYEVIIVDDGSTDNSPEVVARFGDRVRCIRQENLGLAGARNTGIRAAQGELIGLLDADDQWLPNYLETMVSLADNHPEAVLFYCVAQCIDELGNDLPQVIGGPIVAPEDVYWALIQSDFIIPSTVLLRKSIAFDVGLFDQSLRSNEDWDFLLRLLPENKIIGSPLRLVRYRIHNSSLSVNVDGMHQAAQAVILKHFGVDNSQYDQWTLEKRRAYGGLYWYQAWTSLTRLKDWELAEEFISKAIVADPSLGESLDFFYELAEGDQPSGYRGSSQKVNLVVNVDYLDQILHRIVETYPHSNVWQFQSVLFSTAYFAFGILAYNLDQDTLCRSYLTIACKYRWPLMANKRFMGLYFKSLLGARVRKQLRNLRGEQISGI